MSLVGARGVTREMSGCSPPKEVLGEPHRDVTGRIHDVLKGSFRELEANMSSQEILVRCS